MWSDNETDVDLLQFKYLASSLIRIIKSQHLLPTTIGVFGDWGSGKSSLLKMAQKELAQNETVMCLTFNGWLFEGFEDAKTALMGTILDEIQDRIEADKTLPEKARDLLGKLRKRVNWLQLMGMAGRYGLPALVGLPYLSAANIGLDALKGLAEKAKGIDVEEAKKILKEAPEGEENVRRNIRDFRKDFERLLAESNIGTLVVFIDDLDRCLPDTIIETLEAIKLFLFVPGTAFVLGADERLIEYAVRMRFPELPGTETEVGRDYLEKLVQIPIRIPSLSGAEIESYINTLFAQLRMGEQDYKAVCERVAQFRPTNVSDLAFDLTACRELFKERPLPAQLEGDLDLTEQIAPVLTPGLGGNPRRTKRFLNTLLLRMALGEDRGLSLQRQVLAKLMLLEYLKPEFFKQLAVLQSAQEGRPSEIADAEATLKRADEEEGNELAGTAGGIGAEGDGRKGGGKAQGRTARRVEKTSADAPEDKLPAEIQPWLADSWMRAWLTSEPALTGVDLRPYFYVAHDKVGALEGAQTRLSPAARDVLNKLLDAGRATQEIGLRRSEKLSGPDATAVFETLAQRVRQAESLDDRSPQRVLFALVEKQPGLLPQLVTLYNSLPETKITAGSTTLLYDAAKETPSAPAALQTLERWSRSGRQALARAARAMLNRAGDRSRN